MADHEQLPRQEVTIRFEADVLNAEFTLDFARRAIDLRNAAREFLDGQAESSELKASLDRFDDWFERQTESEAG
jgi:hypothetical protein